jgi:N-acetylglucosamine-6-phosphate deacetylase
LNHTTHLYNAMSSVLKFGAERRGGVVEASLLLDELTTELIADGHHLPPELMQLAVKCKGVDRVLLVTDAQRAAGMPDGEYEFGRKGEGAPFVVRDGVAKTPDGSGYASSTIRMMDAVRVARELIGVTLSDAVKMASLNPARVLGVEKSYGTLEPGKVADIALFDDKWQVQATFVEGRPVYQRRL